MRLSITFVITLLVALLLSARAEAQQDSEPRREPPASPETVTSYDAEEERPASVGETDEPPRDAPQLQMQCRQLVCLCADPISPPEQQSIATMNSTPATMQPHPDRSMPPQEARRAVASEESDEVPTEAEQSSVEQEEDEEQEDVIPPWHHSPSPFAGFLLNNRQFGIALEAGYPFFDFHLDLGLGGVAQLTAGYRGLYSMSNAGYAGAKFRLYRNSENTVSLSLTGLVGYTGVRSGYTNVISLVGGDSVFGELHFNSSIRRGRNTLFIIAGVRVSHVQDQECEEREYGGSSCSNHPFQGDDGALVIGFAELGYGVRIMRYATFFFGVGADLFINGDFLPALPRGRIGLVFDL